MANISMTVYDTLYTAVQKLPNIRKILSKWILIVAYIWSVWRRFKSWQPMQQIVGMHIIAIASGRMCEDMEDHWP